MAEAAPVYEFEWDPTKARAKQQKHELGFEEAATVFLDAGGLCVYDTEHGDTENLWLTLGFASTGRLLVVCHTFRDLSRRRIAVRIFSSRKATRKEAQSYGS